MLTEICLLKKNILLHYTGVTIKFIYRISINLIALLLFCSHITFAVDLSEINTPLNEFAPAVSPDGSFLIYHSKTNTEKYADLYISIQKNGRFQRGIKFSRLNSPYNDESPFISGDGNTIMFSSDRDGSFESKDPVTGKIRVSYDLYWSHLKNGEWSYPEKIPGNINSPMHERSPSLSGDKKTLFYSQWSQGDIESARIKKAQWEIKGFYKPQELPAIINSNNAEVALVPSNDNMGYYFSSRRPGGLGGWDIYFISYHNGEYGIPVNLGPKINSAKSEAYFSLINESVYYASDKEESTGGFDIFSNYLEKERHINIHIYDDVTKLPLPSDISVLKDDESGIPAKKSATDIEGNLRIDYNEKTKSIDIFVDKDGYMPFAENIKINDFLNDSLNINLKPVENNASIDFHSIYFDFNSSAIKSESARYLDKMVDFLNKNNARIKIIGHTDLHGSEEFNLKLSMERALSVKNYLVEKGILSDRLLTEGAGKSLPVIPLISDRADRLNRRTQFKIEKLEP